MLKRTLILVIALSVIISASFLGTAQAFVLQTRTAAGDAPYLITYRERTDNSPFNHWDLRQYDNSRVPYSVNAVGTPDVAGEFAAVDASFASWQGITPSAVSFTTAGVTALAIIAQDQNNVLFWDENINAADPWDLVMGTSTAGLTAKWIDIPTGRILESDIIFNGENFLWSTINQSTTGEVTSANAAPFALVNGQTLTISVNGGAAQTVTFNAADFANIGAATAAEVAAAISAQIAGAAAAPAGGNVRIVANVLGDALQVTGGTANPTLGFDTNRYEGVGDVQTIATHEIGHLLGLSHTPVAGAVMVGPMPNGLNRVLQADDSNGLNYLYTPEHGDAPDSYVTRVKTGPVAGQLNGIDYREATTTGPEHIFGYQPSGDVYEWLGTRVDAANDPEEGEAKQLDRDEHEDGVRFGIFRQGAASWVDVTVNVRDAGAHTGNRYLNAWLDFNGDGDWNDPGEKIIGTNSGPASNGPAVVFNNPGQEVRKFALAVPNNAAAATWARFRLDFKEDVGLQANVDATLNQYRGAAQFGEVEDYKIEIHGNGWWEETETPNWWQPPMPSPDPSWRSRAENTGYRSPHGGFVTSSNLCKLCHAVHRGVSTGYRLLRDRSRSSECVYCHWGTSAVSNYKMYIVSNPKGEHSIGSTSIPDSSVNGGLGDIGNLRDRNPVVFGGEGAELDCYQCHSVHGANTIGADSNRDGTLDPIVMDGQTYDSSDTIENWNYKILRVDPAGDGSVLAKGEGGLTPAEWAAELAARPEAVRTAFCADCHNLNPNWARSTADEDRPNKRSHVQGPGANGELEIYGDSSQTVAWDSSEEQGCRGCHSATDDDNNPGSSQFPHQSVGNKLLDDSYDTTPTGDPVGDPARALPEMDQVCLGCHRDPTDTQGVGLDY